MTDSRVLNLRSHAGRALFLAALLLWVLNHPLLTITHHDARIYSILGLHWLNPEAYARDPFFMFGSQDSFSLFSPLYGPLIEHLGLRNAATFVLLTGALLWCYAAIRLAFACLPKPWAAAMAVLALATISLNYSPNGATFVLNENFATARSIAFPLGLLALAECVLGKVRRSLLLAAASMALHPLIGIWPLAVGVLWPLSWRWRFALIGLATLSLAGVMLSELGPFVRFDAEWEQVLRSHTHDVLVGPWLFENGSGLRWRAHGVQLLVLLTAAWHVRVQSPLVARGYLLVAIVAAAGFCTAMLASYWWPSRIVIQAQLWRSMWMAAALMPVAAIHLLLLIMDSTLRSGKGQPWLFLTVIAALFMLNELLVYGLLLWLLYVLAVHFLLRKRQPPVTTLLDFLAGHACFPLLAGGLGLLALPVFWAELTLLDGTVPLPFALPLPQLSGLLIHGGVGAGFALLANAWFRWREQRWLSLALIIALILAFAHWDMRREPTRRWESAAAFGMQGGMRSMLKPGDVVLWGRDPPLRTWYELRTAHYASPTQAIGMVFSREKTFLLFERVARIRAAYAYEQEAPAKIASYRAFDFAMPQGKGIFKLCEDVDLDWVIADPKEKSVQEAGMAFQYKDGADTDTAALMYLYRCSDFRAQSGAA